MAASQNKLALVTGSTGGIGLESAKALAQDGFRVIINGRSAKTVEAAVAEIRNAVPNAQLDSLVTDNSTADGCAQTIAAFPEVDVLVNNLVCLRASFFSVRCMHECLCPSMYACVHKVGQFHGTGMGGSRGHSTAAHSNFFPYKSTLAFRHRLGLIMPTYDSVYAPVLYPHPPT